MPPKPTRGAVKDDSTEPADCFVIMPISDPDGYPPGHFARVFEDIFVPAIERAKFKPIRADQVRATNLIHLDVLQKLIDAPIALCDLSSHNPNVLFELGLRQAFDKPVVLVQEAGTRQIFDIAPLRYAEYRRARVYHEVLEDQKSIADAISETVTAHAENIGVNSLVKILSLTRPASLPDVQENVHDPALQLIRAELNELRLELRRAMLPTEGPPERELPEELAVWTRRVRRLYEQHEQANGEETMISSVRTACGAAMHEMSRLERRALRTRDLDSLERIERLRHQIGVLAALGQVAGTESMPTPKDDSK